MGKWRCSQELGQSRYSAVLILLRWDQTRLVFTINTGRVLSMCCHVFFFDLSSKERRVAVCNFVNPRPMRGKPQESKLEPAISVLSIFSSPEPAGPRLFPFPDLQIRTHPGSLSTGSYKLHSPVLQSETMACQRSSPQRDRSRVSCKW